MEKNKYTLITIIILLTIFLPFTIYGTYKHYITTTNFKREFKFNGKLWFYNEKKLVGTYDCHSSNCDYAVYASGQKSSMINNNYAFIIDGKKVFLYNIKGKSIITNYDGVDKGEDNNYFVMKTDEQGNKKWGALEINIDVKNRVGINYDSISYQHGKYIVSKDNNNIIIQSSISGEEVELFTTKYEIEDFNDNYIIVYYSSPSCPTCSNVMTSRLLYDYDNYLYFSDKTVDEFVFIEDFILLRENYNNYIYNIDAEKNEQFISSFYYEGSEKINYKVNEQGNIEIYAGEELQKTIEFNEEQ